MEPKPFGLGSIVFFSPNNGSAGDHERAVYKNRFVL